MRKSAAATTESGRAGSEPLVRTAVVLDEQPLWVSALSGELEQAGIAIVGSSVAADAALALARQREPDVFVVGLEMPNAAVDGPEFIRRVRAVAPHTRIVALSIHSDPLRSRAALAAGADAFCAKTASVDEIVAVVMSRNGAAGVASDGATACSDTLTPRELEILELVARGYTNAAIAKRLWVTEWTVKFHLANTYRKLGVSNRTQAARYLLDRALPTAKLERPA